MTKLIFPALQKWYDALDPMAYTALRVLAGGMMLLFGFKKLFITDVSADLVHMQRLGLEPAMAWAYFVVSVEFFASLCVVVGLLTRPFALMLLGLVTVMLVTTLIPRGEGYQLGAVWFAAFALIAVRGGDRFSVDRWIGREF